MAHDQHVLFFLIDFTDEFGNCVALTFERDDLFSEGNINLVGVDCISVQCAKVVCEVKKSKLHAKVYVYGSFL